MVVILHEFVLSKLCGFNHSSPVEELLRVQLRLVVRQPLHEVTPSGRLVHELRLAHCQRLQQHTDLSAAVGLEPLGGHGVQRHLVHWAIRGAAEPRLGAVRPQQADLGVSRPEGDLTDAS